MRRGEGKSRKVEIVPPDRVAFAGERKGALTASENSGQISRWFEFRLFDFFPHLSPPRKKARISCPELPCPDDGAPEADSRAATTPRPRPVGPRELEEVGSQHGQSKVSMSAHDSVRCSVRDSVRREHPSDRSRRSRPVPINDPDYGDRLDRDGSPGGRGGASHRTRQRRRPEPSSRTCGCACRSRVAGVISADRSCGD